MNRDIKIQIKDNADPTRALHLLSEWFTLNKNDPQKHPLTGIISSKSGMRICRRMYRKTECFIAWQD